MARLYRLFFRKCYGFGQRRLGNECFLVFSLGPFAVGTLFLVLFSLTLGVGVSFRGDSRLPPGVKRRYVARMHPHRIVIIAFYATGSFADTPHRAGQVSNLSGIGSQPPGFVPAD
jgi:hypothetical protein